MIRLLLSTLRLSLRWSLLWLRSRTTAWLVSLALYGWMSLRKAR